MHFMRSVTLTLFSVDHFRSSLAVVCQFEAAFCFYRSQIGRYPMHVFIASLTSNSRRLLSSYTPLMEKTSKFEVSHRKHVVVKCSPHFKKLLVMLTMFATVFTKNSSQGKTHENSPPSSPPFSFADSSHGEEPELTSLHVQTLE